LKLKSAEEILFVSLMNNIQINLWVCLKYKKPDFDFSKYLEIPMTKTVCKSFYTVDTLSDGRNIQGDEIAMCNIGLLESTKLSI
jgi:hypothetical protein